jgi:hypothetical protein
MYTCNDGTTATTCKNWIVTNPIINDEDIDDNDSNDEKPTITTWFVNRYIFPLHSFLLLHICNQQSPQTNQIGG